MGGDKVPWALDEEHAIDTIIAELKALEKAIPQIILVLMLAKAGRRKEVASA